MGIFSLLGDRFEYCSFTDNDKIISPAKSSLFIVCPEYFLCFVAKWAFVGTWSRLLRWRRDCRTTYQKIGCVKGSPGPCQLLSLFSQERANNAGNSVDLLFSITLVLFSRLVTGSSCGHQRRKQTLFSCCTTASRHSPHRQFNKSALPNPFSPTASSVPSPPTRAPRIPPFTRFPCLTIKRTRRRNSGFTMI